MFGELPKIFGKEFLVGYFLPAAIFLVAASLVTDISNSLPISSFLKTTLAAADEKKVALYLGSVAVVTWGVATLFLVVNFTLIRALEGYGWLNPARLLRWRQLQIFNELNDRIDAISNQKPIPHDQLVERRRLRMRLANEFPESKHLVLPTKFGNVIRAFERYPQVIYNIEAIRTWTRLQAVLPESYRSSLDAAKALLDCFVNLWFASVLIAMSSLAKMGFVLVSHTGSSTICILGTTAVCGTLLALLVARSARGAAAQWGELVKGAFDLYRGDLCKQLGFELPRSIERERKMWEPICRTMIYRKARYADQFTSFRPLIGRDVD